MEGLYLYLVKRGKKTVEQVHGDFREKVKARLAKEKQDKGGVK